jgi:hypothetical protein
MGGIRGADGAHASVPSDFEAVIFVESRIPYVQGFLTLTCARQRVCESLQMRIRAAMRYVFHDGASGRSYSSHGKRPRRGARLVHSRAVARLNLNLIGVFEAIYSRSDH